jgi:hypothetical protein
MGNEVSQAEIPPATKELLNMALSSSKRLAKRHEEMNNLIAGQQDEIEHLRGLVIKLANASATPPDPSIVTTKPIIRRSSTIDIKKSGTNDDIPGSNRFPPGIKRGSLPHPSRPSSANQNRAIADIPSVIDHASVQAAIVGGRQSGRTAAFIGVGSGRAIATRLPFKAPLGTPIRRGIARGSDLKVDGTRMVPPNDSDGWRRSNRGPSAAGEHVKKSVDSANGVQRSPIYDEKKERIHAGWSDGADSGSDTDEDHSRTPPRLSVVPQQSGAAQLAQKSSPAENQVSSQVEAGVGTLSDAIKRKFPRILWVP